MLFAMLGFIISAIYTNSGAISVSWGLAFLILFSVMFLASVISLTHSPLDAQLKLEGENRVPHNTGGLTHFRATADAKTRSAKSICL